MIYRTHVTSLHAFYTYVATPVLTFCYEPQERDKHHLLNTSSMQNISNLEDAYSTKGLLSEKLGTIANKATLGFAMLASQPSFNWDLHPNMF